MRDLKTFLQKFMQNCQNVYEPHEDSELLLRCALREIREEDTVLEVGAGSGYVSYFLMDRCRFLIATDINPHAVRCMRELGIDCIRTDLAKGLKGKFSLILFNPPYLELEEWEKAGDWIEIALNGGKNGVEVAARFLVEIKELLSDDGRIILVANSHNLKHICREIERLGYHYEIVDRERLFFEELYGIRIKLKL